MDLISTCAQISIAMLINKISSDGLLAGWRTVTVVSDFIFCTTRITATKYEGNGYISTC